MLWVQRRAQLRAWVSSLVTKPGAAFCENGRISSCIFSTDLPSRTCVSRHTGFSVRERAAKSDIFAPTWHLYKIQKFKPNVFYSSPYSVCRLPGKYGWDKFSHGLLYNRCCYIGLHGSAVLEKSSVACARAQVRGWVQTCQRFSGMAWPIIVRFSPSGTKCIRPEVNNVVFRSSLAWMPSWI